jgi:hypothetical protein
MPDPAESLGRINETKMSLYLIAAAVMFADELTNTADLHLAQSEISPAGRWCYPLLSGDPPAPELPYALVRYDDVTEAQLAGADGVYILPGTLNGSLASISLPDRTRMFQELAARNINLSAVSIDGDDLREIIAQVGLTIDASFDTANFTS